MKLAPRSRQRGFITALTNSYRVPASPVPLQDPYFDYVASLLHFEGSDGATTTTDETGVSWTFRGNAQIDDAQQALGTTSLYLDGTGDYLDTPDNANFELGNNDFTVETFVRVDGTPDSNTRAIIGKWDAGTGEREWLLLYRGSTNTLEFLYSTTGADTTSYTPSWSPTGDTWYHLAVTRFDGVIRIFVDGTEIGTGHTIGTTTLNAGPGSPAIGAQDGGGTPWLGWIDEVRITNGFARWVSDFTTPVKQHPTTVPSSAYDEHIERVVSHLHLRGADAGTNYIDFSGKTWTQESAAVIDNSLTPIDGQASLFLDGVDDAISTGDAADWVIGDRDLTVECWIRPGTVSGVYQVIVSQYNASISQRSWRLSLNSSGELEFVFNTSGSGGFVTTSETWGPTQDVWYHVAACKRGTEVQLFVDGQALASPASAVGTIFNSSADILIGKVDSNADEFDGNVSDVRVTIGVARYWEANFTKPSHLMPSHGYFDDDFDSVGLLLSFEGDDAATAINDLSDTGHTVTFNGNAQIDIDQFKFGASSLLLDGTGDYLTVGDHADFEFGSSDFTVETWVRFSSFAGADDQTLLSKWTAAGDQRAWALRYDDSGGDLEFLYTTDGTAGDTTTFASAAWNPSVDTWYHVAVVRNGADLIIYIDGVQSGSTHNISTDSIFSGTSDVSIGAFPDGAQEVFGHMDGVRITGGVARSFSGLPPTTPHGLSLPPLA